MGYNPEIINPQLAKLNERQLQHLRDEWHDAPGMCALIDEELNKRSQAIAFVEFTTELTACGLMNWNSFFADYLKCTTANAARFYYTCEPGTHTDMTRVRVRCPSADYAFLIGMAWGLEMR